MIEIPTVFVLGAGASKPYGFPLGAVLRRLICEAADGQRTKLGRNLIDNFGFSPEEVSNFARTYHRSQIASIDSFLAKRNEFVDVGKAAIATLICAKENPDSFHSHEIDDDWYFALWNTLVNNVYRAESLSENNVKFITFNYDRSLESYLHSAIKHTFGLADAPALTVLNHIPISHVYGSLGQFGFVQEGHTRPYSPNIDARSLNVAAQGIKIIPESRNDDAAFEQARDWFRWTKRICFLGFGFDELNVSRLGLKQIIADRNSPGGNKISSVFASTFEMTEAEIDRVASLLLTKPEIWNPFPGKSLATLRQYGLVMK